MCISYRAQTDITFLSYKLNHLKTNLIFSTSSFLMAERNPIGNVDVDQLVQSEEITTQQTLPNRDRYLNLPSNLMQAYAMRSNTHTGMYMVQLSIDAQRACNEAIIFVYGVSGHGKSQSLNHLFGFDLIPVQKLRKSSDTKAVTEYVAKLVSDSWEVKNLEIGFIDAPGWKDTDGEQQDAKNMAAIQQFIENHPHLGSRIYKCYPNIILIALNVTDKRIDGSESDFCKMLNAMKYLNIVDTKKPNVLVILTHARSLPPGDFLEEVELKKESIKRNCKRYIGVEPPVVCLENKPDLFRMPEHGEWTVIEATDEKQPLNLFQAMIELMAKNGDEVGVEAVRIYFPSRGGNPPIAGATIHSEQVKFDIVQKWRRNIIQKERSIISNDCIKIIQKYEHDNKRFPKGTFNGLMLEFNVHGIDNKQQIHHKDIVEVQEQFWPYILGETEKDLIISQFGVKPVHYPEILREFGTGLFLDDLTKTATEQIFNFAPAVTRNGVMVPTCMQIRYCGDTTIICKCVTGDNATDPEIFREDAHAQITSIRTPLLHSQPLELQTHTFKFAIIHNIFRMDLQMTQDTIKHISDGFTQAVQDLPEPQTMQHDDEYFQFIHNYGDCFRCMLEGGGIITGEIELHMPKENIGQTEMLIQNHIQIYLTTLKRDEDQERELVEDRIGQMILNKLFKSELTWNGGSKPELPENNLDKLNKEDFERWKRSLHRNPITVDIMQSKIETNHIYEIVGQFDRNKASKIKKILKNQTQDVIRYTAQDFEVSMLFLEKSQRFAQTVNPIGEDNPEPENPDPINREEAAQVVVNSVKGYPSRCLVEIKKVVGDEASRVVRIEEVEEGDWILCIDQYFRCIYDQVSKVMKSQGDYYYLKFGFGNNKTFVSGNNCHILSTKRRLLRADKLLLRDRIYSMMREDDLQIKEHQVGCVKITKESGNVYIRIINREDLFVIVDNVIVGEDPCFPGNATVVLRGGERVRMDELKIGDYVLSIHPTTHKPVYSKVYLWAHRDPHITATFLHITHTHGHLHISANHLILTGDNDTPVPAHHLTVGDSIHFISSEQNNDNNNNNNNNNNKKKKEKERGDSHTLCLSSVHVLHIHTCTQMGYYTPFTNNGLIVVDNIATSVYCQFPTHSQSETSTFSCHTLTRGLVQQFGMHRVGQCVLTPVRVGCKLGMGSVLSRQMDTHTHIHKYCQWLLNTFCKRT